MPLGSLVKSEPNGIPVSDLLPNSQSSRNASFVGWSKLTGEDGWSLYIETSQRKVRSRACLRSLHSRFWVCSV